MIQKSAPPDCSFNLEKASALKIATRSYKAEPVLETRVYSPETDVMIPDSMSSGETRCR
tara:strand:+ start:43687 stop:43863 length:177 start_codon:yes stop_codon:yes gene_type:complete